jgi:pantoate--beta-alanine ligase
MIVARTVAALRQALSALPRPLGLVPTMGALHAGHLALLDAARAAGARSVVASVFVNPLQFGNPDDLARYPRTEDTDLAALQAAGCDAAWLPTVDAMYPPGACTVIDVAGPSAGFEGAARPGHFRGVATVVAKLFHQTGADLAMFGEKDWQQVQVVRRMVADLDWPITVVPVPTVREPDGLALSSRNRFLSPADRALAPVFYRVLQDVADALRRGRPGALPDGEAALRAAGLDPEYLAMVDGPSMQVIATPDAASRLIGLVRLGAVRLLDNVAVFG